MTQCQKACVSEFATSGGANRMRPEGLDMYDYEDSWEDYDETIIWYYSKRRKHKGLGEKTRFVYIPVNRSRSQCGRKSNRA